MLFGTYLLVDSVFSVIIFKNLEERLVCHFFSHVLHSHDKGVRAPQKDLLKFLQLHHFYLSYIVSNLLKPLIFPETSLPGRCPWPTGNESAAPEPLSNFCANPRWPLLLDDCINICYCVTCMFFGLYILYISICYYYYVMYAVTCCLFIWVN